MPCCRFGEELSGAKDADLKSLMNHPRLRILRERLASGQRDPGCSKCYFQEDNGQFSDRQFKNREISAPVHEPVLTYLELSLGNHCNLRCRSCSSQFSSAWIDDEREMYIPEHFIERRHTFDPKKLEGVVSGLTHIKFMGGEPFITLEHVECLRMLDQMGRLPYLQLEYSTNATIRVTEEVLKFWSQAASLSLAFSIDGLREKNDQFRRGSKWEEVIQNAHWYMQNARAAKTVFLIHTVVNADNVHDIPEIDNWLSSEFPRVTLFKDILLAPDWLAIRNLPLSVKKAAAERISAAPQRSNYEMILAALREPALIGPDSYKFESGRIDALEATV